MNYYERIQQSIVFIESSLDSTIEISKVARAAYMSLSNFYRLFFAMTGYSVKEYIRLRRIHLAAAEVMDHTCLIDLAVKYDFESGDSFSRAFRRATGLLPSDYRKQHVTFRFERINLMEKYFDIQDPALLEKYPDIKVLKEIEPMRVAYYCYYGKSPEDHAFAVIKNWLNRNKLNVSKHKLRIFGYNNPSPTSPEQEEYGYEVCVTIDDSISVDDPDVKVKTLEGGLYAVTTIKSFGDDMGLEIMNAWGRFNSWQKDSKYTLATHQWMEEHLGFDDDANHVGGMDLYMPITER